MALLRVRGRERAENETVAGSVVHDDARDATDRCSRGLAGDLGLACCSGLTGDLGLACCSAQVPTKLSYYAKEPAKRTMCSRRGEGDGDVGAPLLIHGVEHRKVGVHQVLIPEHTCGRYTFDSGSPDQMSQLTLLAKRRCPVPDRCR